MTPQVTAALYEDVENIDDIRAALMDGTLPEFGASQSPHTTHPSDTAAAAPDYQLPNSPHHQLSSTPTWWRLHSTLPSLPPPLSSIRLRSGP